MGITTKARNRYRNGYIGSFDYEQPNFTDPETPRQNKNTSVVELIDMMQFIKGIHKDIMTLDHMIHYLLNQVKQELYPRNGIDHVVVQVDKVVHHVVKALICHTKRYKDKTRYEVEEGPYLPQDGNGLLPDDWMAFAGNRKLLQREFYTRLFNAFIDVNTIHPGPGQSIILDGFPGRSQLIKTHEVAAWEAGYSGATVRRMVVPWNWNEIPTSKQALFRWQEWEDEDPDMYNRVFVVKGHAPSPQHPRGHVTVEEWDEATNAVGEADLRLFYYDHFFRNHDQMICINDGDAIPISLLYAHERKVGNKWVNTQWLKLKKGGKAGTLLEDNKPRYEYINVNSLYDSIMKDEDFVEAGVQNPVATMVFLTVFCETDFVKGHMKGIGKDAMWDLFMEPQNLKKFSHLVQLSTATVPDTRTPRRVVIDEDLFFIWIGYCYAKKYGKSALKMAKKKGVTAKEVLPLLKDRCSKDGKGKPKEDENYHFPNRNLMRRWCRWILWNMQYWINGMRGVDKQPNEFEIYRGHSYYGFMKDPETGKAIEAPCVSAKQKRVDTVYRRNFLVDRQENMNRRRRMIAARDEVEKSTFRRRK